LPHLKADVSDGCHFAKIKIKLYSLPVKSY
jgi:hypothetical protein